MDAQQQNTTMGTWSHPSLQTINKRASLRPKPPPPEHVSGSTAAERVPLKTPRPRDSRSSLKGLIGRTKAVRRNSSKTDLSSPSSAVQSKPFTTVTPIREVRDTPSENTTQLSKVSTVPSSVGTLPPGSTPKPSRSTKQKRDLSGPPWEPPPLFKAYPQAVKHATLSAPTSSAEAILRLQGLTKQEPVGTDLDSEHREKRDYKQAMKATESLLKLEWTKKIFVLVTSGYLLQYSSEGHFDRLPEFVLEIGDQSAAFASDAIPGKHWVLQISHTCEENGTTAVDNKKSFLSRFRLLDSPKMTKSLLLVLDSAEELASWMLTMRRMIESFGGKEYVPETPMVEETPQPSHRFRNLMSGPQPPPQEIPPAKNQGRYYSSVNTRFSLSMASSAPPPSTLARYDGFRSFYAERHSMVNSVGPRSCSTSTTTSDSNHLKDGCRLSYASAGTRTIPSSCGSSPPSSSAGPHYSLPKPPPIGSPREGVSADPTEKSTRPISIIRGSSHFRKENGSVDTTSSQFTSPQSASSSPMTARNFSVPVFSKRFSSATNLRHQPSSSNFVQTTGPSFPIEESPYCSSSETSIDSTPEDPEPAVLRQKRTTRNNRSGLPTVGHGSQVSPLSKDSTRSHTQPKPAQDWSQKSFPSKCNPRNTESGPPNLAVNTQTARQTLTENRWPFYEPAKTTPASRQEDRIPSLRRPLSLQIRPTQEYFPEESSYDFAPTQPISKRSTNSKTPAVPRHSLTPALYTSQIQSAREHKLSPRRSTPQLGFGPPPAPPPNCPLPDIPQSRFSRSTGTWKTIPAILTIPTPPHLRHIHASTDRQKRSTSTPRTSSSTPRMVTGTLGDIRSTKSQGLLQAY